MSVRQTCIVCVVMVLCLSTMRAPAHAAVSCIWSVASGVDFGTYDVYNGSVTTTNGTLAFRCVGIGSGTADVGIDLSQGNALSYTPRFMLNGAQHLNYNLYLDAFGLFIWGDGSGGSSSSPTIAVSNNQTVTLTVYGRIPAGQDLPSGSYSDQITATINF